MKQLFWIGKSYKVLTAFPKEIKQAAGFQLHLIQQGHDPDDWKPMQSIGAGVREIRVHVAGEHRITIWQSLREVFTFFMLSGRKCRRLRKRIWILPGPGFVM